VAEVTDFVKARREFNFTRRRGARAKNAQVF